MNNKKCSKCGLVNRIDSLMCLRCKSSLIQRAGAPSVAIPVGAQQMAMSGGSAMERPLWVMVGLWGLGTKSVAWAFVGISVAVAMASIVFWSWWGAGFFLSALWYWLAIRWVDQNGSWQK